MPSWCRTEPFSTMRRRRRTGRSLQGEGAAAAIALDKSQPLNDTIGTSLRLDVTQASTAHAAGVANDGYWGIPVKPNTRYRASFYAKAAPGFGGPVAVSIQSNDGKTIYASGTVAGVTRDVEAVRSDAPDAAASRQRPTARYVLAAGSARHGLVQPGLAVPADLQESAERLPRRHHADDGRHEAEVPALPGRQLPRGGSDRRPVRVEEDARAARGTAGPHRRRGVTARRTAWACTSSCCGAEDMDAEPVLARLCRLLAQGRARESGTRPRAVRAGRARRDRVRDRAGDLEVGSAAREGGAPAAVQADLRRGRQRRLVRQVRLVRSALRAVQHGDQGALSAAQGDLDGRLRAAGTAARPQRQAGRPRRALLPDGRRVPEDGARAVRDATIGAAPRSSSANGPPTKRRSSRGMPSRAASRRRRTCRRRSATPPS